MERLTNSGTREAKPNVTIKEIKERLTEYEDLEEQGWLLRLPCEADHLVYEPYQFLGEGAWEISVHKLRIEDIGNIGKTVFLKQEEAEAAISAKTSDLGS